MKRKKYLGIAIILCLMVIFSTSSDKANAWLFNLGDNYFPLKEGMTQKYRLNDGGSIIKKIHGERELNNKKVIPEEIIVERRDKRVFMFYFWVNDSSGVYLYARQGKNDIEPIILQKPYWILKYPLKIGSKW